MNIFKKLLNWSAVSLVGLSLFSGCSSNPPKPPTQPEQPAGSVLLVANSDGSAGSMTTIDIINNTVRMGAAGLGNVPNDIVYSGNRVFVVNSMSNDMNVLRISNENVLTQLDTVDLGNGTDLSPQYATLADNGKLYITNFNQNMVTVLDTATMTPDVYIPVGAGAQDIFAFGDKIFVCISGYDRLTQTYGPGSVAVISTTTPRVVETIPVGTDPQFMTLDPARNLHVVCSGIHSLPGHSDVPGEIYKISTRVDTVLQVINIGGSPGDIAITSTGIAYIAAGGWVSNGEVYRYNAATGQILNGPANPISVSTGAMRIVAASDNSVYVACSAAQRVDRIVTATKHDSYVVGTGPGAMLLIER